MTTLPEITIRDVTPTDFDSIIKLNEKEVQHTAHLDLEQITILDQLSEFHKVAIINGQAVAFLLVIRSGAPYQSFPIFSWDNFRWFSTRMTNFLYVDRIVVDAHFFGMKIGSKLYENMFEYARSLGIKSIVCEYNIQPPNLVSHAFHEKFGFKEIGSQWVANGTKLVSMQELQL